MSFLDEIASTATSLEARILAEGLIEIRDAIVQSQAAASAKPAQPPVHGCTPDGARVVIARERITHVTFAGRYAAVHLDSGAVVTILDVERPIL